VLIMKVLLLFLGFLVTGSSHSWKQNDIDNGADDEKGFFAPAEDRQSQMQNPHVQKRRIANIIDENSSRRDKEKSKDSEDDDGDDDEEESSDTSESEKTSFLGGLLKVFDGRDVCGIDFTSLQQSMELILSRPGNVQVTAWESLVDQSIDEEECHDNHHYQFVLALDNFNACSGWNLQNALEVLPSALSGSLMRCAHHFVDQGDEKALVDCIRPLLLDNPIGDAFKGIYLQADQFCSCLKPFSDKVPSCRLDAWPVPLVGSWLQKFSCLMEEFWCGKVNDFCVNELRAMDACLPNENELRTCESELLCGKIEKSFSLSVPSFLRDMPLPDACSRVYGNAKNNTFEGTNIIKRYQKFQSLCNDESTESRVNWNLNSANSKADTQKVSVPANTFDDTSEADALFAGKEQRDGQPSQSSSATYQSGFKTGLISGSSICVVLGLSLFVYGKIRKNGDVDDIDRETYRTVEMTDL
jgi:hypothetical protein